MRHCRQGDDNLLPRYDPVPDVHVDLVGHPDNVEVHSQAKSLGVDGLEKGQAEEPVDIEMESAIIPLDHTGVDFGADARKKLWVSVQVERRP